MNTGILIHPPRLPDKLSVARVGYIDRRPNRVLDAPVSSDRRAD
ncbi:hypothetical protein [Pseudomonas sp.]